MIIIFSSETILRRCNKIGSSLIYFAIGVLNFPTIIACAKLFPAPECAKVRVNLFY